MLCFKQAFLKHTLSATRVRAPGLLFGRSGVRYSNFSQCSSRRVTARHFSSNPFLSPSFIFYFPPPCLVAALFFASPMCSTRFSTPLFAVANLGNVPVSDREGSAGRSRCALSHASLVCPPRSASSPLVFFPLSCRLLRFDVKYSDVSLGHTSVVAAEACLHAFVLGY